MKNKIKKKVNRPVQLKVKSTFIETQILNILKSPPLPKYERKDTEITGGQGGRDGGAVGKGGRAKPTLKTETGRSNTAPEFLHCKFDCDGQGDETGIMCMLQLGWGKI